MGQKIELENQLHAFQRSELYKAIILPLEEEINGLKHAYDCKTLQEMAELKGLRRGLDKIFQLMFQLETDADTERAQIKADVERALRNKPPEDSQDL
jgi:hypothetical protein